ncbi:MAG: hypothetical protein K1X57_09695 [Gemmataceae bacterium]|nr:hypothetical protein [Gemmataceae bacterium]
MRWLPAILVGLGLVGPGRAGEPATLLQLLPKQADAALVVDRPRLLVESVAGYPVLQELTAFEAVREQLASTSSRQLRDLVRHFEKELGKPWPDLLDALAGKGACLGIRFAGDSSGVMLIVHATDEPLLKKALAVALDVIKSAPRADDAKIASAEYRGVTGYQVGPNAFVALSGPVMFLSNKREAIRAGIDLHLDGPAQSFESAGRAKAARDLLPRDPLAWFVASTERLHEQPEAKQAYEYPKGDLIQLILFQGIIDTLGKAPGVAGALTRSADGMTGTIRMPAGRQATPSGLALHYPADKSPGSLPLLEPKDVLLSTSFYLDLSRLWNDREKLLTEKTRQDLEKAEKDLGRFLGGRRLSEILAGMGTHHRVVVTHQSKPGYAKRPDQPIPAFAFVSDIRDPAYPNAMNAILRLAAFIGGAGAQFKYAEETIGEAKLITYRFPESKTVEGDGAGFRFNFSPCFGRVGDQYVVSSTVELARELIPLLNAKPGVGEAATSRLRVYGAGGATVLKAVEDQLLTQTILDRAVSADDARKEAARFIDWVRTLGSVGIEVNYSADDMRLDFHHRPARTGGGS